MFLGPYFHFCLELALETWSKTSLKQSLWVHHTHSASFQWTLLSNQPTLLITENCLQYQNGAPTKGRGVVSTLICANKVRNGPGSSDQGHHSTASQGSHHVHGTYWICLPTSPYCTFLLVRKLSSNGLHQLIMCGQSQMTPKLMASSMHG